MSENVIPDFGGSLPKKYKSKTYKDIDKLNIKSLMRMVILGPSYSGKNNLVFYILKNAPHIYTHLHIICRNRNQELYLFLEEELGGFITFYDAENIPSVDHIKKNKDDSLELVVIDDFSNDALQQKTIFSHYFIRGRHFHLSTIFLSHSWFKGTDKIIRINSEYVAILKANSKMDLKMILRDFNIPGVSEEQFYKVYSIASKTKGQMLLVDSIRQELRYNFNQIIDVSEL